ncbi:MAG: transglutaminase domain-containing protein [Bacteroidia bacterium]|nr:transglutaminase domain-containing protein [Bacteroidia bacterium]
MRTYLVPFLFFYLIFLPVCFSQKVENVSEEDIALAKQLKESYPEEDLACLSCKLDFEFDYNEEKGHIGVMEKARKSLISISQNTEFYSTHFYNEQSRIPQIWVRNKGGKLQSIEKKDEYYQSSEYFYSDARLIYFQVPFSISGSIREINYEKEYYDVKYFTSVYFHERYPTKQKLISFSIPDWMEVELREMNFDGFDIQKSVEKDEKKALRIYTYELKDLVGMDQESNSPGPSYDYPHIIIQAKSYELKGERIRLFESVDDLYAWYHSLTELIEDNTDSYQALVQELIAGKTSDVEKAKAIYYWVQDNIRYVAFEDGIAGFKPDESQQVYSKRYGDCKGMANLTKRMLKLAGFDARLTWLGTRRIAYDYSFPSLAVDNHMICTLILDGKKYFLDPTEKYNPFFNYAERIQGRAVMIEDGDEYILDKIPSAAAAENVQSYQSEVKLEGEQLISQVKRTYKGESKSSLLYQIHNTEQDALDKSLYYYLTRGEKNLDAKNISNSSFEEMDPDLSIEYELVRDNAVSDFGEEMYVELDYYKPFSDFQLKDRKTDYLFPHKIRMEREVVLQIPEGFQLGDLAQPIDRSFSDFSFKVKYKKEGNQLIYSNIIEIEKAVLKTEEFEEWNKCIKSLNEFYQQPLTLIKKS